MNKLILSLLKIKQDEGVNRILENSTANKTLNYLGYSFFLIILAFLVSLFTLYRYYTPIQRPLLYVNASKGEVKDLITLAYPQQSRESLENWVSSVIRDMNSLSFNTLDETIETHRKYFIDDASFNIYKSTLESSGQLKKIRDDSLRITTVLLKTPVQIDARPSGENMYWTYRVPVLTTYNSGGVRPFAEKKNITVILVRVPTYKNHGGFGIVKLS